MATESRSNGQNRSANSSNTVAAAAAAAANSPPGGSPRSPAKKRVTALIIIRHGERIDDHRIPGGILSQSGTSTIPTSQASPSQYDWRYDTDAGRARPWDPPLSFGGVDQASAFGKQLPHLIDEFKLPPLGAVYSSPVVRCAETAMFALQAYDEELVRMQREREERSYAAAENGVAGTGTDSVSGVDVTSKGKSIGDTGSNGNQQIIQSKNSFSGRMAKIGRRKKSKGPDLATTLGTVHVHAPAFRVETPKISNLLDQAMDMLGIDHETSTVTTDGTSNGNAGSTIAAEKNGDNLGQQGDEIITAVDKGETEKLDWLKSAKPVTVAVSLEQGLMECIHKPWYDQWCLLATKLAIDGANDTHPMARVPVINCFPGPSDMYDLLGGVVRAYAPDPSSNMSSGTNKAITLRPDNTRDQRVLPDKVRDRLDVTEHVAPFKSFQEEYVYDNLFEGGKAGLNRQHASVRAIAQKHRGQTVVIVTHFVPCAHLFGRLTGRDGVTEHGRAEYTAFSLYVHSDGREGETHKNWRPLIVNDRRHLNEQQTGRQHNVQQQSRKKKYNLRSRFA